MTVRRFRGLLALLLLLALAVGLPWAMAATIGNPLHAWDSIRAGDMSDQDVIAIMAAVTYLAWASFALAVLVEFGETVSAALSHRPRRLARIPLLGAQQDLARTLIATVLLLAPAVVSTLGPTASAFATPATRPASTTPVTVSQAGAHTGATPSSPAGGNASRSSSLAETAVRYVIPEHGGLRSYWALAEHYLDDGQRWPEIWQLNQGRRQHDGSVMQSPQLLRRGWSVLIPQDGRPADSQHGDRRHRTTHEVTVHEGDNLSGLAADDGVSNWRTVWPTNTGHAEPGGAQFTDPDFIQPGWKVTLPGPAATAPPPAAPTRAHRPAQPAPQPLPHRTHPPTPTDPNETPSDSTPGGSSMPTTSARTVPGQAQPSAPAFRAPAAPASADAPSSDSAALPVVAFTAGGALLAGVTLTALRRHRRRQFRWRGPGRMIAESPARLAPMEKALVSATAGVADATWLDQALRGLVQQLAARPDGQLPDVIAAGIDADGLQLVLTTARHDPPSPWRADEAGTRWRISREDELGYDPEQKVYHFAPFPTLSSVGYTPDGRNWLLDLERVGAASLVGDPTRCLNLARYLAAELSHNSWSEQLQVTLVGFGAEMTALNPGRLSHTEDLDGAIAELHRQFDDIGAAADEAGVGVLEGRLRNVAGDVWAPHVLLIAPAVAVDSTAVDRLLAALRTRAARTAIALVLSEPADVGNAGDETGQASEDAATRWQLEVTGDGMVRIPALGLELIAQQLPVEEAADLAALLALAATTEDRPMPAPMGEQPWDELSDAAGAPRPEITVQPTQPPADGRLRAASVPAIGLVESRPMTAASLLPLPTARYLEQSAATAADLATLAPTVSADNRRRVEEANPGLDEDLAEWRNPDSLRPKLMLLCRPRLEGARGQLPPGRPRLDFYTEVVTYLATRPGATVAQLGAALWPNDPDVARKTTPRQAVGVVRKWLGVDPRTGREHVPYGGDGRSAGVYRVDGLLVDAELFRRLRLRAVARGAASDGIEDLLAALELVQGVPLEHQHMRRKRGIAAANADTRPGDLEPYSWLVDDQLGYQYRAMITDVAHTVATHFLGAGDPVRAAAAAQVPLRAGSDSDDPLCDLVFASDAQDRHVQGDEYVRQIMTKNDAEVEEDLPPRTYEKLLRRRYAHTS